MSSNAFSIRYNTSIYLFAGTLEDLECPVCKKLVKVPLVCLTCKKVFCKACVVEAYKAANGITEEEEQCFDESTLTDLCPHCKTEQCLAKYLHLGILEHLQVNVISS